MNGEHKITSGHRDRAALIYLRQSSMAQVRDHTESTMRQYGLADEAVRLGWARPDVEVIDTDLGISGRFGVIREGFDHLVVRLCRGEVGAIFGIEISRLARSYADVARLMEFCRITGTLLIDPDGRVRTALVERPRAEWPVLIKDHHEGYISWADYLANQARLAGNRTNAGARPPREGGALCQGIIACGSCGKPMRINYHSDQRPPTSAAPAPTG